MTNAFTEILPEFGAKAATLNEAMTMVSLVLVFFGLTVKFAQGSYGDYAQIFRALVAGGLVAAIIPVFPDWMNDLQMLGHSLVTDLDADPSRSHERFSRLIGGSIEKDDGEVGFWDILWADEGGMGKALLYAAVFFAAKVASAFMWLAMVAQQIGILFGVALAPPFIAMFLIESLRGIAVNYLLRLASLALWPLGWAVADLVSHFLLELSAGETVYQSAEGYWILTGSQSLFFIIVLTLWISLSTMIAPRVIGKVLREGANAGSLMLSQFGMSLGVGVSQGIGAAVTAGMAGGSRVAMATAGGVGAVVGMGKAAMGGNGGALFPAAVGVGAATVFPKAGQSNAAVNQEAQAVAKESRS